MTDEERQDELIELPLSHHKVDWETVEKGDGASPAAPPPMRHGPPPPGWCQRSIPGQSERGGGLLEW